MTRSKANKIVEQNEIKGAKPATKSKDRYESIIKQFGLDETYTKSHRKAIFDNVKSNIPPLQDYNFQADLLMLPKTKTGYKYLLVIVDLWSDEIDAKPLKTKQPEEVLKAMLEIFKSANYLKKPYATIRTDAGTEFKGAFHKWLFDNNIYHSVALPHRHKQLGNVENVNGLIGKILNLYMNKKEEQTGEKYTEWDEILQPLLKSLNKIRKRDDKNPFTHDYPVAKDTDQKFKIGDIVIRKLDSPINALNNPEQGKFRKGDYRWHFQEPRKIIKILYYPKNIRYVLEGLKNVSFTQDELMKSNAKESKFAVRAIVGKRGVGRTIYYRVWFKNDLKKNALWIPKKQLVEDGLENEIKEYENTLKK